MAKSQAEFVQEVMAGPDGAEIAYVHCGFRESEDAAPCGCAIPVHLASNVHCGLLLGIQKPWHKITLHDIEDAGGFLCDEHLALIKLIDMLPDLVLTTKQINDLGSRRRNEAIRAEEGAAKEEARHQALLAEQTRRDAAEAFAVATFGPRQRVVKRNGHRAPAAATA